MAKKSDSLEDHKGLKAFKQLGFKPKGESGNQVTGNCVLCGNDSKFFVNPEKKMWDCKVCGKAGGFQTILKEVKKAFKKNFNKKSEKLARDRQLPSSVFKSHNMGFNPANNSYILPIPAVNGTDIWDIRIYKNKKFMSLSGCSVGLFGWDEIDECDTIYICEGEWDKMALEIMLEENDEVATVMSVPGAQTFKREWVTYFEKKNVILCYDADEPGKKGAIKAGKLLKGTAKSIQYLIWPEDTKDGYDVRDFFVANETKTKARWNKFKKLLSNEAPYVEGDVHVADVEDELDVLDGDYVLRDHIHKVYDKWLYLADTEVLDVMYGTIIANRLEGDPLWLFMVAPPGGTKTELINSVSDAPNIVTTSSLTPRSLVSGANTAGGGDPSLIPKLNNKTLLVKDFTTILNMNQLLRDEIFGILRDAYDGKTEKDFGNGVRRSYRSKFGLISGVTPAIDVYTEGNSSLGERFLRYDIPIPKGARARAKFLAKAEDNAGKENAMREELAELGTSVLKYDFKNVPDIPQNIKTKLISLAQFVSLMRGTVVRNKYSGEATHQAFSELGTRMVKQFTKFLFGVGMYRNIKVITNDEYRIVCRMGMSTIPKKMEMVVKAIYDEDHEDDYSTKEVAELINLPPATVGRTLDDLMMLGLMNKDSQNGLKSTWSLSEDAIYLIEESEIYK